MTTCVTWIKKEIVFLFSLSNQVVSLKEPWKSDSTFYHSWMTHTTLSTRVSKTFLGDNKAPSKWNRNNERTLVSHHLSPEFPERLKPGICSRHLPIHTLLYAYSLLTLFVLKYVFWQLHISVALGMCSLPPRSWLPLTVPRFSHSPTFFAFSPGELNPVYYG